MAYIPFFSLYTDYLRFKIIQFIDPKFVIMVRKQILSIELKFLTRARFSVLNQKYRFLHFIKSIMDLLELWPTLLFLHTLVFVHTLVDFTLFLGEDWTLGGCFSGFLFSSDFSFSSSVILWTTSKAWPMVRTVFVAVSFRVLKTVHRNAADLDIGFKRIKIRKTSFQKLFTSCTYEKNLSKKCWFSQTLKKL